MKPVGSTKSAVKDSSSKVRDHDWDSDYYNAVSQVVAIHFSILQAATFADVLQPATGVCDAAGLTKSSVRQDGSKVRNPTELLKLLVDSFREYCPIINPGRQKRKPKYVLNQVLSRQFVKSLLAYFINIVTLYDLDINIFSRRQLLQTVRSQHPPNSLPRKRAAHR